MVARYVRLLDSESFDSSSLVPNLDLCFMDCPIDYCWFLTFSSTWPEGLYFEVPLRQVHTDPTEGISLDWHNVKDFSVRFTKRSSHYVDVNAFRLGALSSHRVLLITTLPVFPNYSRLAFDPRYSAIPRANALTEFGACPFLSVCIRHIDAFQVSFTN